MSGWIQLTIAIVVIVGLGYWLFFGEDL